MSRRRPGSRHFAALNPTQWSRARKLALDRAGWRCNRCHAAARLQAHHVIELHRGGAPFDLNNLEILCADCHRDHHRKPDPEREAWRELLAGNSIS